MQTIPNLTEIRDRKAGEQLLALLSPAVRDLRDLSVEPIVVGSSPWKFNDADHDTNWQCIRVGAFLSERQDYFERPEDHDKRLREGPEGARAANRVLERLEAAEWRNLYQRAYDREIMSPEEVIALVLQEGSAWLVINGSNDGESAVYDLTSGSELVHVGRCSDDAPRFDQGLAGERPLVIRLREDDAADGRAARQRIAALERRPERDMPEWYRRGAARGFAIAFVNRQPSRTGSTLRERLETLAKTGRVSQEEFDSLNRLISRSQTYRW